MIGVMPQQERPNERRAAATVARHLHVQPEYVDLTGGVDYRFERTGRPAALEVTRRTSPVAHSKAAVASKHEHVIETGLLHRDWAVTFDGFPSYKGLKERLVPALMTLEQHHFFDYHEDVHRWWLSHVPTLREALDVLADERVRSADAVNFRGDRMQNGPISRVFLNLSSAWVYGGVESALTLLESLVADSNSIGDRLKLDETHATERHLWIWLDRHTDMCLRHALETDEDRLPERPPALPREVTHLWCVDEPTGRGWYYSPDTGWAWIGAVSADTDTWAVPPPALTPVPPLAGGEDA